MYSHKRDWRGWLVCLILPHKPSQWRRALALSYSIEFNCKFWSASPWTHPHICQSLMFSLLSLPSYSVLCETLQSPLIMKIVCFFFGYLDFGMALEYPKGTATGEGPCSYYVRESFNACHVFVVFMPCCQPVKPCSVLRNE